MVASVVHIKCNFKTKKNTLTKSFNPLDADLVPDIYEQHQQFITCGKFFLSCLDWIQLVTDIDVQLQHKTVLLYVRKVHEMCYAMLIAHTTQEKYCSIWAVPWFLLVIDQYGPHTVCFSNFVGRMLDLKKKWNAGEGRLFFVLKMVIITTMIAFIATI